MRKDYLSFCIIVFLRLYLQYSFYRLCFDVIFVNLLQLGRLRTYPLATRGCLIGVVANNLFEHSFPFTCFKPFPFSGT